MKITPTIIGQIQTALAAKKMSQSELASRLHYHRSHISKLLKGEIETLTPDLLDGLNDVLDIDLVPVNFREGTVSPLALRISELAENNQQFTMLIETLCDLVATPEIHWFMPQVDQKRLIKIGAELTRIVHEWEDGNDPHYAKIAAESLDYIRRFYAKCEKSKSQQTAR